MTTKGYKLNRTAYKALYAAEWAENDRLLDEVNESKRNRDSFKEMCESAQYLHKYAEDDFRKAQRVARFWLNAALAGWTLAVVLAGVLIVVR